MPARKKASKTARNSSANLGFEAKMPRLVAELAGQFAESEKLESAIRNNLKGLGYAL